MLSFEEARTGIGLTIAVLALTFPLEGSGMTLALGAGHTCVLTDGGAIECFGGNFDGQLGNGSFTSTSVSVPVPGFAGGGARRITAGFANTCAIDAAEAVSCWGVNYSGQLGDGTTEIRPLPVFTMMPAASEISAGGYHVCALDSANHPHCWGDNQSGQLGRGAASSGPNSTPMAVVGLSESLRAIAPGGHHVCGLLDSGGVVC